MHLQDALRMRAGDFVSFRFTQHRVADSMASGLGIVVRVTAAGGVLVNEYENNRPPVSLERERWVPYNRVERHLPRARP